MRRTGASEVWGRAVVGLLVAVLVGCTPSARRLVNAVDELINSFEDAAVAGLEGGGSERIEAALGDLETVWRGIESRPFEELSGRRAQVDGRVRFLGYAVRLTTRVCFDCPESERNEIVEQLRSYYDEVPPEILREFEEGVREGHPEFRLHYEEVSFTNPNALASAISAAINELQRSAILFLW